MVTTRNRSARSDDPEIEPPTKRQKTKNSPKTSSTHARTSDTGAKALTAEQEVSNAAREDVAVDERPEDLAAVARQIDAGGDELGSKEPVVLNEPTEDLAAVATQVEAGGDERDVDGRSTPEDKMRSIQRLALEKFMTLFGAAKSAYGGDRTPFLETGKKLEDDQVLIPIMAVTEAIRYRPSPRDPDGDLENMFDITDSGRLNMAKFGETTGTSSVRPGKPLLVPWIFNETEQLAMSGKADQNAKISKVAKEAQQRDKSSESHIFLLLVKMNLGVCEVRIFDSYRGLRFRRDSRIWPLVLQTIHKVIRAMAWIPGDDSVSVMLDDHGYDAQFGPEVEVHVAHQGEDEEHTSWACGFHTILNAWTVAMNLLPNRQFRPSSRDAPGFYDKAAEMINLVMAGLADSNLLYAFLVGYGFALPSKVRQQCPSFSKLGDIHPIRDRASLTDYVDYLEPIEQVKRTTSVRSLQNGSATPLVRPQPGTIIHQASSTGYQHAKAAHQTLIEPAIMANDIFANADAMAFWHKLNSSKHGKQYINHQKFATESSIHDFIEYIVHNLKGKAAESMSHEAKVAWFTQQRYSFDKALTFDTNTLSPTPQAHNLQKAQLYCFRRLWQKELVSLNERYWLIALYKDAMDAEMNLRHPTHNSPRAQERQHHHRRASDTNGPAEDRSEGSSSARSRRSTRKRGKDSPITYAEEPGDEEDQLGDDGEDEAEEHSEYENE